MDITILDFILINFVFYIGGMGTGIIICLKNKDKLLVKSRSIDDLSIEQINKYNQSMNPQYTPPPLIASAPDKTPIKITLE
ncbi:MAG: hypothetical protein CMG74_06755 [Candidatus Marinimicrobia bacterium]|nr:hypothetical protein [Candidatus Neomarinimicrobiota bacterium]|tara:strand:+ start:85 stop:327 length:243 start_codon:yes stop_codon:yes gene_type:complete